MVRWFRHYAGMTRDEKLTAAALESGQPFERVFWLWSALLEDAAERDSSGYYLVSLNAFAWSLHCDQSDLCLIMSALDEAGRLEWSTPATGRAEGRIGAWGKRQSPSDRSTVRVRKHRARKTGNGDETVSERSMKQQI